MTEEIKLLNKEVAQLKSQNKSTEAKLDKKDAKLKETQKQLKKKDASKRTLTKEQQDFLSKLFQDINTLF